MHLKIAPRPGQPGGGCENAPGLWTRAKCSWAIPAIQANFSRELLLICSIDAENLRSVEGPSPTLGENDQKRRKTNNRPWWMILELLS
jgi:hypothetical protein